MENNNPPKKVGADNNIGKKQKVDDRKEIKGLILKLVEEKAFESKFSDRHFDREKEKHQLLSGVEFSIRDLRDYVLSKAQPYSPMYPTGYFKELCRLFQWPESEAKVYRKRREVAMFTREVVYGTFDKSVLVSFEVFNPYKRYLWRKYKHFQFFNDAGLDRLTIVIGDCLQMMESSKSYYEFRKKWFEAYGVPYQQELFE